MRYCNEWAGIYRLNLKPWIAATSPLQTWHRHPDESLPDFRNCHGHTADMIAIEVESGNTPIAIALKSPIYDSRAGLRDAEGAQ